jgi:hypothetical protein
VVRLPILSPREATLHFATAYQGVFRRKWRSTFDMQELISRSAIRAGNAMSNRREFSSFWAARQFADALGMPYDASSTQLSRLA